MVNSIDPVSAGIVANFARPGGSITGLAGNTGSEFEAKRLQLLKQALPDVSRIAFLGPKNEWEGPQGKAVRDAASTLGITLVHIEHSPNDYASAFAAIKRDRPHALFGARHASNFANRKLIADFANEQRLPGIYHAREIVAAGGLMSYGVSVPDLYHRAAGYVDKILKGAVPGEIPVEQPTKFELVINGKTAKVMGLTISPTVFAIADEIIE